MEDSDAKCLKTQKKVETFPINAEEMSTFPLAYFPDL